MFIGRKEELKELKSKMNPNSAVLVYGLRRVGKTTFIKKAVEEIDKQAIYFECIKASEEFNVKLFIELLVEQINFPNMVCSDFISVFKFLNEHYKNYVFVLDEYSFLKEYYLSSKKSESHMDAERIDSEFKSIIDNYLTNNSLILCGSSISIMKNLIVYNAPLYDRFVKVIHLKPLTYIEANEFFADKSKKTTIEMYSIFGGSPNVLKSVDKNKSLKENVCELPFSEEGKIIEHIRNNITAEFDKDPELNMILNCLRQGSKKYSEIEDLCKFKTNGLMDKKIKKMLDLDIIEKKYQIGVDNQKRKTYYSIKDNLLKFYYSYIYGNENKISLLSPIRFYEQYVEPSVSTFISHRFENIVKDYFALRIRKGALNSVIDLGTYFSANNEFDCVLKNSDGTYDVYEVKYTIAPVKVSEIKKELAQIDEIKGLKIGKVGFVSASGYEETLEEIDCLTIEDVFDVYLIIIFINIWA